jgi:mono/diheme cytochrome c family protein
MLMKKSALQSGILAACLVAASSAGILQPDHARADEAMTNPFLGQPEAIAEGDQIYRSKCVICHGRAGGRGPNLFATRSTDEQFMEVVINGRKGTMMPAWGFRLSPDDVWKVHAFVKSRPGGL